MKRSISRVALVVDDYDKAIAFFTTKLDFELLEDIFVPEQNKRWVTVAPPNSNGTALVLARASDAEQERSIGNQTGGRVFLFLSTDDFWRDHARFEERGIKFVRAPAEYDYGTVAVFTDLYGNLWDLVEYKEK